MPRRASPKVKSKDKVYGPTFIREWREFRGLSQDRLVERVREYLQTFSKSTLSRIERREGPYSQPILEALAYSLQCDPADLLMRKPDAAIWSIIDSLEKISPADRETVTRFVQGLRRAS